MGKPIYLDYNATTPIAPEVVEAMIPYLYDDFGNPSSIHPYGVKTRNAVEHSRGQIAALLNCLPEEIVFTSGGTESNNTAIRGVALANQHRGKHIITTAIEHPAVSQVCKWLATQGFHTTFLPVNSQGLVNPIDLEKAISSETILVTIMHANNEVGTLQPIKQLAEISHKHGSIFHTDAAQTVGKVPVDVNKLGCDLLSIAGHKFYAPKGIGALYIRNGIQVPNLMFGAGHEAGRRPGTENVLAIVGLGAACTIANRDQQTIQSNFILLRDRLFQGLISELGSENLRLNGHPTLRLPNTLNIGFYNVIASDLLGLLGNKVAASAGSACHADLVQISDVLLAMNVPLEWASGTIRFSVGRNTTKEQVDQAVDHIVNAVNHYQKPDFFQT